MRGESPDEFWTRYYQQLCGFTVIAVSISEGFPQLTCVKNRGTDDEKVIRLEISQDEEGNGPGFLFGVPKLED